ncbi:fimbrial protein [Aeromonas sp. HMWF014]|jgi:type 1 fimbria pilin|uniref:fimbrial protein n=1 Tax=Aeromonas sp. HMWF014 TaxID=2056850 RepID=UPI000D3B5152|nr:fimbrial protein [Aeromonas sp. HMWF014]PTT54352.1 fimbrial protein [Aeromonas sp. HMWF014]
MLRLVYFGLLIIPLWVSAAADDLELLGGELNLHGRIIAQPCVISPESADQSVDLGVVDVRALYSAGTGEEVKFFIRLTNCKPGIFRMAKVTFSGTADPQMSGALAFSAGSAKGAGIRLYNAAQTKLDLGTASSGYALGDSTENELLFYARVEGHPKAIADKNITPGDYTAVANFIVSYE